MIVLWAMSLWGAAIILVGTGYGSGELERYGIKRASLVVLGAMVWILGWWTARSVMPGVRIDIGFMLLSVFAGALVVALGNGRLGFITALLALMATIVRLFAPVMTHQAQVMPVATIESLGLGSAAGISLTEPLPAAAVGAVAEAVASMLIAWRHVHLHDLGRHDMAMSVLAALSAWLVGWLASRVAARLHRIA